MIRHDDTTATGPTAVRDPEAAVVARLHCLSTQLDGDPDAVYRARARARLVAMAAVRTPEPARPPVRARLLAARALDDPPSRWRGRITAGLAGAAVGVTGLAALVAVAAGAGPGDPLYDLKRGTEQTQLALAGDSRGQTLLELADTRLEELDALAGDGDATLFRRTLQTMDAQTVGGAALLTSDAVRTGDRETLDALAGWTAEQSAGLGALRGEVPAGAAQHYAASAALLDTLSARAAGLQPALECPTGPATVGDDELGPVPGPCLADAPPPVAGESAAAPQPAPTPAPAAPGTSTGPGTPPAADPGPPALPSAPSSGTVGVPAVPGQTGDPNQAVTAPRGGGVLTPLPEVPLPGRSAAGTATPNSPPVAAVPVPAPPSACLPRLATIGSC